MKRILLIMALSSSAYGQTSMSPCWLSGSETTCIKPVNVASGGTGNSSLVTAAQASTISAWDAQSNMSGNNLVNGYSTFTTGGTTTTLNNSASGINYFIGSSNQTVKLPAVSTLSGWNTTNAGGQQYQITNASTGTLAIQSSGANAIITMAAGTSAIFTAIAASGTGANTWTYTYQPNAGGILDVAHGGTGLASGTSGGVLAYTASGTLASSGALTQNAVVIGGGAGVVPTVVTNNSTATNKFLTQSSSGAPAWATIVAGDLPAASTSAQGAVSYEDSGTFAPAFTGARSTTPTWNYARVGKLVSISWANNITGTCTINNFFNTGAGGLPSGIRPATNNMYFFITAYDTTTQPTPGVLTILTDGTIQITKTSNSSNFTTTSCGWLQGAASWNVN